MTEQNRYRQPTKPHTLGHLNCPACEELRALYLHSINPSLPFAAAADLYMQMRTVDATPGAISARYIRRNTEVIYRQHVRSLGLFFGDIPLKDIHFGHIRAYQMARLNGSEPFFRKRRPHEEPSACKTKPQAINQEMCFLRSVMRRAGAWSPELDEFYEELQEQESEIPRALEPHEQQRWLDVSRLEERWAVIHWYSIVAFDTTMSTNELRGLRIGDINLHHQTVNIPWPAAKNKYRHRSIAIDSADCLWALERLIERARDLGAVNPQHYLFPARNCRLNVYEPQRHMSSSGLKKLWQEVRDASGLTGFRLYDTRHTAITRMAEAGVPLAVIMAKAGHLSPKMSQHYTHVGLAAQRRWNRHSSEYQSPAGQDWERAKKRVSNVAQFA